MSSARLGAFTTAEWNNIQADAQAYNKIRAKGYTLKEAIAEGKINAKSKSGYGYSVAANTARAYKSNYKNYKISQSNKLQRDANGKAITNKNGRQVRQMSVDSKGRAIIHRDRNRNGTKIPKPTSQERKNMTRSGSPTFSKTNRGTQRYTGTPRKNTTTVTRKKANGSVQTTKITRTNTRGQFRNPSVRQAYKSTKEVSSDTTTTRARRTTNRTPRRTTRRTTTTNRNSRQNSRFSKSPAQKIRDKRNLSNTQYRRKYGESKTGKRTKSLRRKR